MVYFILIFASRKCCNALSQAGTFQTRQSGGLKTPPFAAVKTFNENIGTQIIPNLKYPSEFKLLQVDVQYPCGMDELNRIMGKGKSKHFYPDACIQRPASQQCKDQVTNPKCLNPMDRKEEGGWDLYYNVRYCKLNCEPSWNEWQSVVVDAPPKDCDIPWCSRSRTFTSSYGIPSRIKKIDFKKQDCPAFKFLSRKRDFKVKSKALYGNKCEAQNDFCCCPVDCKGEWLDWSPCSVTCGYGTQGRGFTITQTAQCGGKNDCTPKTQYRKCIGTTKQKLIPGSQYITYQGGLVNPPTLSQAKKNIITLKNRQFRRQYSQYKPLTLKDITLLDCGLPSPPTGKFEPWSCYRPKKPNTQYPKGTGACLEAKGFAEDSLYAKWTQHCHPFGFYDKSESGPRRSFKEYFAGLKGAQKVTIFYQLTLQGTQVHTCDCDVDFLKTENSPVSPTTWPID